MLHLQGHLEARWESCEGPWLFPCIYSFRLSSSSQGNTDQPVLAGSLVMGPREDGAGLFSFFTLNKKNLIFYLIIPPPPIKKKKKESFPSYLWKLQVPQNLAWKRPFLTYLWTSWGSVTKEGRMSRGQVDRSTQLFPVS